MYNEPSQEMLDAFVRDHVIFCQTILVEELFNKGLFEYDDVLNACYTEAEILELGKHNEQHSEFKEVYEWWIVDEYLIKSLLDQKESLLENAYGTWWGRTTTGQSISLDPVIKKIFLELINS